MMNKLKTALYAILAFQLILVLIFFTVDNSVGKTMHRLVAFDLNQIDRIEIGEADKKLNLIKENDVWMVDTLTKPKASTQKIQSMLEKVMLLEGAWPVATTEAAQHRFEVSAEHYQRKLVMYGGDEAKAKLYFGTSPGYRKTHIRAAKDDNIYALAFNIIELPLDINDWIDESVLSIADVDQFEFSNIALNKNKDGWIIADKASNPDGQSKLDQDKTNQLISRLENLTVTGITDNEVGEPLFSLKVVSNNKNYIYQFEKKSDAYLVSRNDVTGVFTLSQSDFDKFEKIKLADLLLDQSIMETENGTEQSSKG